MTDPAQLHQGSAARPADKPQGGGAGTPRLKNSPTLAQLRSQLADAALEWARADELIRYVDFNRNTLRAMCIRREIAALRMGQLAAKIEAVK